MSGTPGPLLLALARGRAQPWFEPYAALAMRLDASLRAGLELPAALADMLAQRAPISLDGGRLRFVDVAAVPPGFAYETFIAQTACVPTRSNVHDMFNALVWLRFPALKARLNRLQAGDIEKRGIGPARGPLRDALTLFDENGALWAPPAALARALATRDWQELFLTQRGLWRGQAPLLFGHALLEKLLRPRKGITAHVWLLPSDADACEGALRLFGAEPSAIGRHLPLPVLGVPGWWPANEAAGFYADAAVFRPLPR